MKIRNNFLTVVILLFTITIFLVSASESANEPQDSGTLLVKVTDAPFPVDFVERATVTIDSIEIRQKSGTADNPYVVISNIPIDFDLLELRNGITSDLPEINVPIGSYDLVRLHVVNAKIVLKDGSTEFNLKVPSGDQTGIKIFIKPEIQVVGGLTSELILDFDLNKSFVVQGNPNKSDGINGFSFKPVIRAANNSTSGRIYGLVTEGRDPNVSPLANVLIQVIQNDDVISTASSDDQGYYELVGLTEGSNQILATLDGYIESDMLDITVVAGNRTEQNFVLVK